VGAQLLGDGQHKIGGGGAFGQLAFQPEADDIRRSHDDRLAEHHRLSLDASDAPAQHAQPIDHRGVRVRADQRVRIEHNLTFFLGGVHHAGQVLEVDLMHDAGRRRDDAQLLEALLPPAQELISLAIALELEFGVAGQRFCGCEEVHLNRVIDDQVDGHAGLIWRGSPPRRARAARSAARSTTAGTPVKSCISTRAGRKGTSGRASAWACQPASERTSCSVISRPLTWRSRVSSKMRMEKGVDPDRAGRRG